MGKKDRMIYGSPHEWANSTLLVKRNPKFAAASLGFRLVRDAAADYATIGGEWNWENDFKDYPRPEDIYKRNPMTKRTSLSIRLVHNIND